MTIKLSNNKPIVVKKFGGTSLAKNTLIKQIAKSIESDLKEYKIVVIVSAMYGKTSQLIAQCLKLSQIDTLDKMRELNAIISTGEQISAGLLCLSLQELNIQSKSLQAWQIPIITDNQGSNSKITEINAQTILRLIDKGIVPVVCGFQGINVQQDVTTIGRGGSDTTAVAIAKTIQAHKCQICTDVEHVYTADPRKIQQAKKMSVISHDTMLEMAKFGTKVLNDRAASIAAQYKVELEILHSYQQNNKTVIGNTISMENSKAISITEKSDFIKVTLTHVASIKDALNIIKTLSQNQLCCQNIYYDPEKQLCSFDSPIIQNKQIQNFLFHQCKTINYKINKEITYISIIGYNLDSDVIIMQKVMQILQEHTLNMCKITAHHNRITLTINMENLDKTISSKIVKKLHNEILE